MIHLLRSLWPFLLSSCAAFDVEGREILLRYQPETDVLDVLLVHEGVGVDGKPADIEHTAEHVRSMAGGRRHFSVWGLLDWDVDALVENQRKHPIAADELDASAVRALLDYQSNLSVVAARLLIDEAHGGRLCLLQRLRFEHGARFLGILDTALNAALIDEAGDEGGEWSGDPRTDALQLAHATAGGSWIRFDGAALVLSVPMTPEYAATQLKQWLEEAASPRAGDRVLPRLLDSLTAFQATAEELRLTFASSADGWIHFRLPENDECDYQEDVAEHLARDEPLAAGDLAAEIQRLKALP